MWGKGRKRGRREKGRGKGGKGKPDSIRASSLERLVRRQRSAKDCGPPAQVPASAASLNN